jgi:UDP-2,3-diacylglucosamine pyrophosphatase LpxH
VILLIHMALLLGTPPGLSMVTTTQYIQMHRAVHGPASRTHDTEIHDVRRYRTVWISDVHLGTPSCKEDAIVGFLNHIETEFLILHGDIIDGWWYGVNHPRQMGRIFRPIRKQWKHASGESVSWFPQGHVDVGQKLFRLMRHDAITFYHPGNHDQFWRPLLPAMPDIPDNAADQWIRDYLIDSRRTIENRLSKLGRGDDFYNVIRRSVGFGNTHFLPESVHETASGERVLTNHGDQFDHWFRDRAGAKGTQALGALSGLLERLGLAERFSLAEYLAGHVGKNDIMWPLLAAEDIRRRNATTARRRATDEEWKNQPYINVYVGGHTHIPCDQEFEDPNAGKIRIFNTGDWVENCTALVEHYEGNGHKAGDLGLVQFDEKGGIIDPYIPGANSLSLAAKTLEFA